MGAAMVVGLTVLPASAGQASGTTPNCSNGMTAAAVGNQANKNNVLLVKVATVQKTFTGQTQGRVVTGLAGARSWLSNSDTFTGGHGYCEGIQ